MAELAYTNAENPEFTMKMREAWLRALEEHEGEDP